MCDIGRSFTINVLYMIRTECVLLLADGTNYRNMIAANNETVVYADLELRVYDLSHYSKTRVHSPRGYGGGEYTASLSFWRLLAFLSLQLQPSSIYFRDPMTSSSSFCTQYPEPLIKRQGQQLGSMK